MRKLLGSREIVNKINKLGNRAFTWRDFEVTGLDRDRIQAELSRLSKSGVITRKQTGVYYVPARTLLGPGVLSDIEVVSTRLREKKRSSDAAFGRIAESSDRIVPVGGTLFYEMGLTTQVPARKEYVSTIRYESPRLRVRQTVMDTYKDLNDEEVRAFFCLCDFKKITNESFDVLSARFVSWLKQVGLDIRRLREICGEVNGLRGRQALSNLDLIIRGTGVS